MCVGILLRSLAKLSGREPAVHQLCLRLGKKREKGKAHSKKPQPHMGEVPLILSPFSFCFLRGFIVVLGRVLSFEFYVNVF